MPNTTYLRDVLTHANLSLNAVMYALKAQGAVQAKLMLEVELPGTEAVFEKQVVDLHAFCYIRQKLDRRPLGIDRLESGRFTWKEVINAVQFQEYTIVPKELYTAPPDEAVISFVFSDKNCFVIEFLRTLGAFTKERQLYYVE